MIESICVLQSVVQIWPFKLLCKTKIKKMVKTNSVPDQIIRWPYFQRGVSWYWFNRLERYWFWRNGEISSVNDIFEDNSETEDVIVDDLGAYIVENKILLDSQVLLLKMKMIYNFSPSAPLLFEAEIVSFHSRLNHVVREVVC